MTRFQEFDEASKPQDNTPVNIAKKPEERPRSAWNRIVIPIANTGFPSAIGHRKLTQYFVDRLPTIASKWHCEHPTKMIYCAPRWRYSWELQRTL